MQSQLSAQAESVILKLVCQVFASMMCSIAEHTFDINPMRPEPHVQDLEVEIFMHMLQNQLSDTAPHVQTGQAPQASTSNTSQQAHLISRYGPADSLQAQRSISCIELHTTFWSENNNYRTTGAKLS